MSTTIATQQFLSFYLSNDNRAMIPTRQLTEVLNLSVSQIVPIPDVLPFIIGVCNWRGEVLWLADLSYMLGTKPLLHRRYRQSNYSVMITHHNGNSVGLVVEQVGEMLWCESAKIQELPTTHLTLPVSPYVKGYWLAPDDTTLLALNVEALMNALRA